MSKADFTIHGFDSAQPCGQENVASIESSMRDLSPLARVLNRIEDPSARKSVIMSKWERGQITPEEAERLIQICGVAEA